MAYEDFELSVTSVKGKVHELKIKAEVYYERYEWGGEWDIDIQEVYVMFKDREREIDHNELRCVLFLDELVMKQLEGRR